MEELARAREKLLGQQEIRNQSNDTFAFSAALDELYGLGANYYRKLRSQVEAVTADEIRRVAQKYFAEQPAVVAVVRPESAQ
jgi:zinc protease